MYTRDAKAMALNNLAASQLNLQQWDAAETSLNEAAALDPLYPMPQLNLAVLYTAKGDAAKAQEHQQRAKDLGLRGDKVDSVIQSMGRLYASYQTQM